MIELTFRKGAFRRVTSPVQRRLVTVKPVEDVVVVPVVPEPTPEPVVVVPVVPEPTPEPVVEIVA